MTTVGENKDKFLSVDKKINFVRIKKFTKLL